MKTTNYFLLLGILLIAGFSTIHAQDSLMVKVKVVSVSLDTASVDMPIIAGLPLFFVHTETSLREEPDYRSGIKLRLYPGTKVEVLDPYNFVHWTKIRVGEKTGWAKKAYLYPENGEIDHSKFLEMGFRNL